MPDTTYGTGATGFSDGSPRTVSTLGKKKKSRVRKKYRKKKGK
jgi:hypothetical protein